MRLIIATALASTLALAPLQAADKEPARRLQEAAAVLSEVMSAPDKGIPRDLLEKAHCIVIVPSLKTPAFVATGRDTCRAATRAGGAGRRRPPCASKAAAWAFRSAVRRRTS